MVLVVAKQQEQAAIQQKHVAQQRVITVEASTGSAIQHQIHANLVQQAPSIAMEHMDAK